MNISKDGDCTTHLGVLLQCLITLATTKKALFSCLKRVSCIQFVAALMHRFILTQVQDFGFPFAEVKEIPVVPLLQPIKVPHLLCDADTSAEAPLVALHVPHQIQFHVVIHFSNPIPICKKKKKKAQNSLSKMLLKKFGHMAK